MKEIINLRDAPEYLTILASWHQGEWSYLYPDDTLEGRISRMQPYLNTDFIPSTFIARSNVLLGSAAIVAHDMETMPSLTPWLASVFVSTDKRRQGIASKLVSHVMVQAQKHGIKTLYLFTSDMQSFYLKLGWTVLCNERYHGQEVTIMQAQLDNII